jgi:hypothetical protein
LESLVKRDQVVEKRKRLVFFGTAGLGLAAGIGLTWFVGAPVLAVGAFLGWDWFKFRGKRGMRF